MAIGEIRRALGDAADAPEYIQTMSRRGYRFVAPVAISNLPDRQTTFVGREPERCTVRQLLEGAALVTLVGPAGVGKTSLALRVAWDLLPELPHGACLVDLAAISDPGLVTKLVATTLGVSDAPSPWTADTLAEALGARRMLLVLDNCEHVVEACATLVDALIQHGATLKILTTSREPLNVDREIAWLVPALSLPRPSAGRQELLDSEAGRLFAARATEASSSFAVTDENAPAISDICRRLDGLPLAIELAAVRVKVLTPDQIAVRLSNALGTLGKATRTRRARHQTLAAALDWSYELLSVKERSMLSVVAVFAGTFTLSAAEAACEASEDLEGANALDIITRLVERSLIAVVDHGEGGERRYRLLEVVRQYALQKLPQDIQGKTLRRLAEFVARIAETIEPSISSEARDLVLTRLDEEYPNLQAALEWSFRNPDPEHIGLRIASILWRYWLHRGMWREGRKWLDLMLEKYPISIYRAQALCGVGILDACQGEDERAQQRLEESVMAWRTTDDQVGLGFALYTLGWIRTRLHRYLDAKPVVSESVELLRREKAPRHLASALNCLADLARQDERLAEAAALYQESAVLMRSIPDPWGLVRPLNSLASMAMSNGDYEQAESCVRDALTVLRPLDDRWCVALSLEIGAQIRTRQGHCGDAARLLGAAEKLRESVDGQLSKSQRSEHESTIAKLRERLGDADFQTSWTEGQSLTRQNAIAMFVVGPGQWQDEPDQ
jgi:non-specific serine/threonine protein kinase